MGSGASTNHISVQNENLNQLNQFLLLQRMQSQNNSLNTIHKRFPSKIQSELSIRNFEQSQTTPTAANFMTDELLENFNEIEIIKINHINSIKYQQTDENLSIFSESLTQKLENIRNEMDEVLIVEDEEHESAIIHHE